MLKKISYVLIGVIIAAAIAAGLGGFLFFKNRVTSNNFVGNFSRIEGNSVFAKGQFYTNKGTYLPTEGQSVGEEIVITSATKIKRVALLIPTQDELNKTGGFFKVDDLEKDISDVDIETFKNDAEIYSPIGLEVVASQNVWGELRFEAKELTYRVAIYPQE